MKIIEEKPITLVEAKEILEGKEKERLSQGKEFGYEQKVTLDYLRKFVFLNKEDAEKLKAQLVSLETLKDHQISMIVDLLPTTEDEINVLFMKERVALNKDQTAKILEIVNAIKPKEKKVEKKKAIAEELRKKSEEAKEEKVEKVKATEVKEEIEEETEESPEPEEVEESKSE